jgi:hypothetical protein
MLDRLKEPLRLFDGEGDDRFALYLRQPLERIGRISREGLLLDCSC